MRGTTVSSADQWTLGRSFFNDVKPPADIDREQETTIARQLPYGTLCLIGKIEESPRLTTTRCDRFTKEDVKHTSALLTFQTWPADAQGELTGLN